MVSRVLLLTLAAKTSAECVPAAKFTAALPASTCSLNECTADPTIDCEYLCGEECCSKRVGKLCGSSKTLPVLLTQADLDDLIADREKTAQNTKSNTDPAKCDRDTPCPTDLSCCHWNNDEGTYDAAGVCALYCAMAPPKEPTKETCTVDADCPTHGDQYCFYSCDATLNECMLACESAPYFPIDLPIDNVPLDGPTNCPIGCKSDVQPKGSRKRLLFATEGKPSEGGPSQSDFFEPVCPEGCVVI